MKQKAPARRRGFFILPFSLVCNAIGQPLPFSRSLFKRRVIFSLRTTSKKKRAARDAGDSRSPTASCENENTGEMSYREVPADPASRTRCFRLAPKGPRWTYLAFLLGEAALSTAGGGDTGGSVFGTRERQTRAPL